MKKAQKHFAIKLPRLDAQTLKALLPYIAIALLACMIYLLVRKNPYDDEHLTQKVSM